jgi:hypothetical protein
MGQRRREDVEVIGDGGCADVTIDPPVGRLSRLLQLQTRPPVPLDGLDNCR